MDKAKEIIKNTFENAFEFEQFTYFSKNLLKEVEKSSTDLIPNQQIKESYQPYINYYRRIWKYVDPNGKVIDVIAIFLKKESTFEARTFQRNFVLDYLKKREKDGVLAAFIHPDQSDWRFSFVKLEFEIKRDPVTGKIKDIEKATSAKRYSYLVGENENSHTAQSQLVKLLEDDENNPTLEEIEQAFGIETVTKEFFTKYKELFHAVEEALKQILKNDPKVKKDFDEKEIDTVDFAKKLLGQIVFLYFLQKKGWFGVERDKAWGTGSKTFLRDLHERKLVDYTNFFNDILEPLFYEALARERDDNFYSKFNCKIPFLNGGLFDPLNNYDWVHTDIKLPNDLFSNGKETKEGDIGDGILDVFDRYNFTVKEDEPLEKEVAIDPEMLGKVFENMLEAKDRKSKGTYYTPREIVHYMCQESLINYLATELEGLVSKKSLEYLIKESEGFLQYEEARTSGSNYDKKMPDEVEEHAFEIDNKLSDIKVCDPAIGSGAFPVGMMNEIVKVRSLLTTYLKDKKERSSYDFKRHAIANSLYGVDIDPGAVEIAKLRLWLSLIVDETDIKNIKPLPNLDYKIMQGNSLLEEYEGIKLFDESLIADTKSKQQDIERLKEEQSILQKEYIELHSVNKLTQNEKARIESRLKDIAKQLRLLNGFDTIKFENKNLFQTINVAKEKARMLQQLQKEYFKVSQKSEKDSIKKEIDELIWDLIKTTVRQEGKEEKLKEIEKIKKSNTRPFFLWHLNFAEVFQSKGGFDVVIGNPPYVQLQKAYDNSKKYADLYKNSNLETFDRTGDIYCLFYEKGIQLLKTNAILAYITSNKWMRAGYGEKLRRFFIRQNPLQLIDLGPSVFENATVDTNILVIKKIDYDGQSDFSLQALTYKNKEKDIVKSLKENGVTLTKLASDGWFIGTKEEIALKEKIERIGIPLKDWDVKIYRGILTGLNEAFIIDSKKREEILANCKDEDERKRTEDIIKPILRGRDIKRYYYEWAGLWVIATFPSLKIDIDKYSTVKKYLLTFGKDRLAQEGKKLADGTTSRKKTGNKWFETQDQIAYYPEFEKEKVVWQEIVRESQFHLDKESVYIEATGFIMTGSNIEYICAYLNSNPGNFFFRKWYSGGGLGENGYRYKKAFLENLPITPITSSNQTCIKQIESLVDQILAITKSADYLNNPDKQAKVKEFEKQIDELVYKLYDLTPEEIKIVEGKNI
ncbi:MAG TPA: TaqI-like C-terminal specificity domain-containing protein [Candidatus Dojkabacteria bacterium]|nr:TaqI-like C-terminal specificity domain-containing protein [Candidatus Dojkabacteria bacterium]